MIKYIKEIIELIKTKFKLKSDKTYICKYIRKIMNNKFINIVSASDYNVKIKIDTEIAKKLYDKTVYDLYFKSNFIKAAYLMSMVNEKFLPIYKKYILNRLKNAFKSEYFPGDAIDKFENDIGKLRDTKTVDKLIISKLKKTKFFEDDSDNEFYKLKINDTLIEFYKQNGDTSFLLDKIEKSYCLDVNDIFKGMLYSQLKMPQEACNALFH